MEVKRKKKERKQKKKKKKEKKSNKTSQILVSKAGVVMSFSFR
jgi:hypothetical protein